MLKNLDSRLFLMDQMLSKGLNLTLSKYVNNRRDSDETKPLDQLRHHPLFNMHLIPATHY